MAISGINFVAKKSLKRSGTAGVTILEILIVLTIIAMIAAVTGPRLIGYLGRAKTETAQLQAQQIKNALQLFYIDIGRYPATGEGLRVLIEAPAGVANWQGPYLESENALSDPWAREYIYDLSENGSNPSVMSYGRDGQKGGSGEDADITP